MFISKFVYKYLCEINPKFQQVIKLNNQNLICKKYIEEMNKDEELKQIFENVKNNIEEITKVAKEKYLKYKNKEKEYNREYCLKFYHSHPEYKEKQNQYKKQQRLKIKKLKEENEKLKNVINNINESLLCVQVN